MRFSRLKKHLLWLFLACFAMMQMLLWTSFADKPDIYMNVLSDITPTENGLDTEPENIGGDSQHYSKHITSDLIRQDNLTKHGSVNSSVSSKAVFKKDAIIGESKLKLHTSYNSLDCSTRIQYRKGSVKDTLLNKSERVMIMAGPGRLGNKMFQFASLIGIARQNGFEPYVIKNDDLRNVFQITHIMHTKPNSLPLLGEHSSSTYDPCLEHVPRNQSYLLTGYYQSWRYFQNVKSEVKKEFTFKPSVLKLVKDFFNAVKFRNRTTIGIHIRRGDMSLSTHRRMGYTTATKEYFLHAMSYFRNKFNDSVFVVCSDDSGWTKKEIRGPDVVYYKGDRAADLAVLANCQHNIVSTGSFGWWAAWLSGGETIYYNNFPAQNTWLATQYKQDDFFPPAWIGMV